MTRIRNNPRKFRRRLLSSPSGNDVRGFTLVEMVVVIILVGILFSMGSVMLGKVFSSYSLKQDVTDADWQAKVALERMTRELRAVRSATAADLAISANQIRFIDTDGNKVCFYQGGTTLMRAENGPADASCLVAPVNARQLADNINNSGSPLSFTYWQRDGAVAAAPANVYYITISFTVLEGAYNAPFRTNVRPRNF